MFLDRIFCSLRNFPKLSWVFRPDGLKLPNIFCRINFRYQLWRDFFLPSLGLGIVTTFGFLLLGLSYRRNSLLRSACDLSVTLSLLLLGGRLLLFSACRFGSSVGIPTSFGLSCLLVRWAPSRLDVFVFRHELSTGRVA